MNEPSDHDALNARVHRAFSRALQAEGFDDDEADQLARRGADLLTASEAPSARSSDKPSGAAQGRDAAGNTAPDRLFTYFFSRLITTRRLALAALAVCVVIGTFTFFNAVRELAKAPRTERSVGRSTVPRHRELQLAMFLISVLLVIFGLILFTTSGW